MLKYCLARYKTQEKYDFVFDWFVKSKIIKELGNALFANDDIIFLNEDSNYITIFKDEMSITSVEALIKLILTMLTLMKMILELLLMSGLRLAVIDLNNIKYLKRNKLKINACRRAFNLKVALVHARR